MADAKIGLSWGLTKEESGRLNDSKQAEPLSTTQARGPLEYFFTCIVLDHLGDDILQALQSPPDERLSYKGYKQPSARSIRRLLEEKSALERLKVDKQHLEILVAANPGDPALRALLRDRQVQLQKVEDAFQVERGRYKPRSAIRKKVRQRDDELLSEFEHFDSPKNPMRSFNSNVRIFHGHLKLTGHQGGSLTVVALRKRLQRALQRKSLRLLHKS